MTFVGLPVSDRRDDTRDRACHLYNLLQVAQILLDKINGYSRDQVEQLRALRQKVVDSIYMTAEFVGMRERMDAVKSAPSR